MKTIIACTDFSATSRNAALYAAAFAQDLKARVLLFHVNAPQESFNQAPVAERALAANESAIAQLEEIASEMRSLTANAVEVNYRIEVGDFFSYLYAACAQTDPYLVVFGSQGTTAAERFLLGSNSVHAMKTLELPLITVPAEARYQGIKKIGLASDFDHVVDSLPLERIQRLVENTHSTLHIINVGKSKELSAKTIFESAMLQEMLLSLDPLFSFITDDSVEDGIIDFCISNEIDILIVFPKEYGFLEELFHKSVSKQLILTSKVPVIVLHPKS